MNIPILRVRDDKGNVINIPAIVGPRGPAGPGTGDMLESVYDTQGKRTDIFRYVDAKIAAIPASISETDLLDMTVTSFNGRAGAVVPQAGDYAEFYVGKSETVDAYSKAETLSDDTKALYGLGADATPDAAFAVLHGLQSGGAKIATGSYAGTGTYGSRNPNRLTFDFEPKLVIVKEDGQSHRGGWSWISPIAYGLASYSGGTASSDWTDVNITWSEKTISWYNTDSASKQLNNTEKTYCYIAIG